jgi:hypothetical protein
MRNLVAREANAGRRRGGIESEEEDLGDPRRTQNKACA